MTSRVLDPWSNEKLEYAPVVRGEIAARYGRVGDYSMSELEFQFVNLPLRTLGIPQGAYDV